MSVLPSDIVVYGSANMPEADGAINGGPLILVAVSHSTILPRLAT